MNHLLLLVHQVQRVPLARVAAVLVRVAWLGLGLGLVLGLGSGSGLGLGLGLGSGSGLGLGLPSERLCAKTQCSVWKMGTLACTTTSSLRRSAGGSAAAMSHLGWGD